NGNTFGDGYKAHEQLCVGDDICEVGDVNGDRKADIVAFSRGKVGSPAYGDVWVAHSNGSTFLSAFKAHDQMCVDDNVCRLGDIDGNRRSDLVAFFRGASTSPAYGDVWVALARR